MEAWLTATQIVNMPHTSKPKLIASTTVVPMSPPRGDDHTANLFKLIIATNFACPLLLHFQIKDQTKYNCHFTKSMIQAIPL